MEQSQEETVSRIRNLCLPGVKLGLIISIVISLAMVIFGSLELKSCPVNKYIPVFLIAAGIIGLITKSISIFREKLANYFNVKYLESPLYIIELIIFFLGSYWVFKEFQPNYDPKSGHLYCKKSVYLFAFIYLAIAYAILLALIAGFLCAIISAGFLMSIQRTREEEERQRINNQA